MAVKILDDPNLKDWEIFKRHLKDFPITSVRLDFFFKGPDPTSASVESSHLL